MINNRYSGSNNESCLKVLSTSSNIFELLFKTNYSSISIAEIYIYIYSQQQQQQQSLKWRE